MVRLVLFDMDGTIMRAQGAGMRAMVQAGAATFGSAFDFNGMATAGGLDPHLLAAGAARCGEVVTPESRDRFVEAYCRELRTELAASAAEGELVVLPGIAELLGAVEAHERLTLGLLTGNYGRTGRIKLEAVGIDPSRFEVAVFGEEAADRPAMAAVALDRYADLHGRRPPGGAVLVVGDTPRDAEAARANGCRCLAVATGPYTANDLREAGADAVVDDLSDPAPFWELVGEPRMRV